MIFINMKVVVNNNFYNVKCLISQKDIHEGMMGKKFDGLFDGLIFFMNEGNHNFWMKNCLVPLDIVFIKNGKVSKIHHDCKPCDGKVDEKCQRFSGQGDLVLEIPGGDCKKYDITEGDQILIEY